MERKSSVFLVTLVGGLLILALALLQAAIQTRADRSRLQSQAEFVKKFQITDLCLATEARYTRHPSQADWHSPFQSHPMALDHFPSGSIIPPPRTIRPEK
jgi:hypothetical protein